MRGDHPSRRRTHEHRRGNRAPRTRAAVAEILPILPLERDGRLPRLDDARSRSARSARSSSSTRRSRTTRRSRSSRREPPRKRRDGAEDIYEVGTAAVIHKMIRVPDGTLRILVQGIAPGAPRRASSQTRAVPRRRVHRRSPTSMARRRRSRRSRRNVEALFGRIIGLVPYLPDELQLAAANAEDPSALANLIASTMRLKTAEKQELLEEARRRGAPAQAHGRSSTASSRCSSSARRSSPRCSRRWSTRSASTSCASS